MNIIQRTRLVHEGISKARNLNQKIGKQLELLSSINDTLILLSSLHLEGETFELLMSPVEFLELSVRSENQLKYGGVEIVSQLVSRTPEELLALKNFGVTSLKDVKERLTANRLSLGMKFTIVPL